MTLDLCPSPALYPFYKKENDTVIVVDIFRASTTMCAMLQKGAKAIITVATTEAARQYKSDGFLVGAERNTRKCDFADFGNSPFDYSRELVQGKEIVFTTTNGTMAIEMGRNSRKLYIGAFSNIDALINRCMDDSERIVILCAGWNNRINMEDTLFGGAFAEKIPEMGVVTLGSDSIRIALELWQKAKNDPLAYLKQSDHYKRLINNGVESDAAFCLLHNTVSVVPEYNKTDKKIRASK
ncbi:MAG: 2-phosphosulfolactate phosphatase [Bacteroidales bacterium]|jgi:2-phosphosulfolactate phosphatase|nr:2-phosphosulfolactate phosphatase [Bacteroidales bacterium]